MHVGIPFYFLFFIFIIHMLRPYNKNGYIIRITERAIVQMILSGLEAYSVAHPNPRGKKVNKVETYGLLWGHEIRQTDNSVVYCIDAISIETSAIRMPDTVRYVYEAVDLKKSIIQSFFPTYDLLGDFHTHPYNHYKTVLKHKQYYMSEGDISDIENNGDYWIKNNYRLGIVFTISRMSKRPQSPKAKVISQNTLQFDLGNYRLWLKAYATYQDKEKHLRFTEHNDENVILSCPALEGLNLENIRFGKVSRKGNFRSDNGYI